MTEETILFCPHCGGGVIIEQINCAIFRHGYYIGGGQINPHMPKIECEKLIEEKKIYGCGGPFKYIAGAL